MENGKMSPLELLELSQDCHSERSEESLLEGLKRDSSLHFVSFRMTFLGSTLFSASQTPFLGAKNIANSYYTFTDFFLERIPEPAHHRVIYVCLPSARLV